MKKPTPEMPELGKAAVGGLIQVTFWTTAKDATEMTFDDLGELVVDTDLVWSPNGSRLYRTEDDARMAAEVQERQRAATERAAALCEARRNRQPTNDEIRDAFFGGATLPADWRDPFAPEKP